MNQHDTLPVIEIKPKDLSPYRRGNSPVDYVHRLDSGIPGPNVIVNALTHGNEFCGMVALTHLLENNIRPKRGTLTLVFANIEAYGNFDPAQPFNSRFVERDFNRLWDAAMLNGPDQCPDLSRARALRPIYAEADALLDIHSTSYAVPPMLVYEPAEKLRAITDHIRSPLHHVLLDGVKHPGRPLIQYGAFGEPEAAPLAVLVECGQHFAAQSGEEAIGTMMRFLDFFDLLPDGMAAAYPAASGQPQRIAIAEVVVAQTDEFRFSQPWIGFEKLAAGSLIAVDGAREIRAPFDDCVLIMPSRRILRGRDVVSFGRPV